MNARDAEALLADAIPRRAGVWTDFGAGDGTFARALARLLGTGSRIYAVDRDPGAVAALERLPEIDGVQVIPVAGDFTEPLELPGVAPAGVDGMLFANALHFVPKPDAVLARFITWLRPGGRVVIVEYDGREPNRWVPYPIDVPRRRCGGPVQAADHGDEALGVWWNHLRGTARLLDQREPLE